MLFCGWADAVFERLITRVKMTVIFFKGSDLKNWAVCQAKDRIYNYMGNMHIHSRLAGARHFIKMLKHWERMRTPGGVSASWQYLHLLFILHSMFSILFKKNKLLFLFSWSFFSFAWIKFSSVFVFTIGAPFIYLACTYSCLFFLFYFVFKIKFGIRLNFWQYTTENILFVTLITLFSYAYYKLVMLDNDYFDLDFFVAVLISNLILCWLFFVVTLLIRKKWNLK